MSHDLAQNYAGREMMAFRKAAGTPWHRLGTAMQDGESFESWVNRAFPYTLQQLPVQAITGIGDTLANRVIDINNRKAIAIQYDNGAFGDVLSVMSNRYKIHQPVEIAETFKQWADDGSLQIETMGTLAGGARMWALARHNGPVAVVGEQHDQYMLLYGSCDGSTATGARFTAVRVVCQNTLSCALTRGDGDALKQYHRTEFDGAGMADALGLVPAAMDQYAADADTLAGQPMTDDMAREFFAELLLPKKTRDEMAAAARPVIVPAQDFAGLLNRPVAARTASVRGIDRSNDPWLLKKVMSTYHTAPGQDTEAARGTKWGAVNAVTHYYDHASKSTNDASRLNSATFGHGARMKAKAMQMAIGGRT